MISVRTTVAIRFILVLAFFLGLTGCGTKGISQYKADLEGKDYKYIVSTLGEPDRVENLYCRVPTGQFLDISGAKKPYGWQLIYRKKTVLDLPDTNKEDRDFPCDLLIYVSPMPPATLAGKIRGSYSEPTISASSYDASLFTGEKSGKALLVEAEKNGDEALKRMLGK